jgi:hypothetical protein
VTEPGGSTRTIKGMHGLHGERLLMRIYVGSLDHSIAEILPALD